MNADQYRKRHRREKGQCTWCGKAVAAPRRLWCSDICVEAFREAFDLSFFRHRVHLRDRGVCSLCGCDTKRLQRLVRLVREQECWASFQYLRDHYHSLGFHDLCSRSQWEADHIVERVRGGANTLENAQTLCLPCHKAKTARLAAERARERKLNCGMEAEA